MSSARRCHSPAVDRRAGVRGALLHTLPGRAIVVGLAIKLAVLAGRRSLLGGVPPFLARRRHASPAWRRRSAPPTSSFRLIVLAKRRLLWRVRRKLILSYIFIGFVPALLLVAFSLLCGFLLFYNFSSYLVQSRLRALERAGALPRAEHGARDSARRRPRRRRHPRAPAGDRRRRVSRTCRSPSCRWTALRRTQAAVRSLPRDVGLSELADAGPVGARRSAAQRARPGSTARASPACWPTRTAATVGGADEDTHLLVRAVAFPDAPRPGYAVVVDLLVNDAIRQQLRSDTGVELKSVTAVPPREADDAQPLAGRDRRRRRAAGGPLGDAGRPEQPAEPDRVPRLGDRRARHADA